MMFWSFASPGEKKKKRDISATHAKKVIFLSVQGGGLSFPPPPKVFDHAESNGALFISI